LSQAIFPRFPGISFGTLKRPRAGRTLVHATSSGKETRIGMWGSAGIWEFSLTFDHLREVEIYSVIGQVPVVAGVASMPLGFRSNDMAGLAGFFTARRGSYDSFLYDDPYDDFIAQQQIGTGTGSANTFQIVRQLGEFSEPIQNINGTPILCGSWTPLLPVAANALIVPSPTAIRMQAGPIIPWQTPGWPCYFMASGSGTTGSVEPNWRKAPVPTMTLTDGSVTWTNMGVPAIAYLGVPVTNWSTTAFSLGSAIQPTTNNAGQYTYVCTTAGTSSGSAPTWPQQLGAALTDGGGVHWQCVGTTTVTTGNVLIVPQLTSLYSIGVLGQLSFNTPPSLNTKVYFTGGFYFRCRFKEDITEFEQFLSRIWTMKKLEFTSVKC